MQKGLPLRSFLAEGGQTQVLILAGIVLTIALAGGIFYLGRVTAPKPQNVTTSPQPSPTLSQTSSPDPTANWKTYTTEEFSIKYPPSYAYQMVELVAPKDYPDIKSVRFDTSSGTIYVTTTKNYLNLTTDNALGNGPQLSYISDYLKGKDIKKFKVDGADAVMVDEVSAGQAGSTSDLIIIRGNTLIQITLSEVNPTDLSNLQKILSTFKFLP